MTAPSQCGGLQHNEQGRSGGTSGVVTAMGDDRADGMPGAVGLASPTLLRT